MKHLPPFKDQISPLAQKRFLEKVDSSSPLADVCHLWTAAREKRTGYGIYQLPILGIPQRRYAQHHAHRIAYVMAHGYFPDGGDVYHAARCRNRLCCNPAHLVTEDPRHQNTPFVQTLTTHTMSVVKTLLHHGLKSHETIAFKLRGNPDTVQRVMPMDDRYQSAKLYSSSYALKCWERGLSGKPPEPTWKDLHPDEITLADCL